ncbi:hypothetical protein Droror1_Dr00010645 [Drosera rotundifolia]
MLKLGFSVTLAASPSAIKQFIPFERPASSSPSAATSFSLLLQPVFISFPAGLHQHLQLCFWGISWLCCYWFVAALLLLGLLLLQLQLLRSKYKAQMLKLGFSVTLVASPSAIKQFIPFEQQASSSPSAATSFSLLLQPVFISFRAYLHQHL